ncbi:MAG TPA: cell division protein SepF [Oscillospiraceae bacterium]|nr:cell division protein SepF [Oscillospiraceae bacterium]
MASIWEKTLTFFGLMEEAEEEETYEEQDNPRQSSARKGTVLNLHTAKNMRLVITKPYEFAEAQAIVDHIKNRKPVLVNMEETDKGEAKRIVDFICGATYALEGNMQKVSQQIFVFAPAQVEVNAEMRRELSNRGVVTDLDKE